MNCPKCNKPNRSEAHYCKWCGTALANDNVGPLAAIVGMDDIKKKLADLVARFDEHQRRMATTGVSQPFTANIIISGEMGTGKTMLVDAIQQIFQQKGIVKHPPVYIYNSEEFDIFRNAKDFDANLAKAKGGILSIDNVHKLLPDGQDINTTSLDRIFSGVQTWKGDPIVILSGLSIVLDGFLKNNPNIRDRFDLTLHLKGYTYEELVEICSRKLMLTYGLGLSDEAREKLKRIVKHDKKENLTDTNGYYANNFARRIAEKHNAKGNNVPPIVMPDEVEGTEYREKTFDEAIKELDKYIGVEKIREKIQNLTLMMKQEAERKGTEVKCKDHFLFLGNPGTGKTTIARIFAEIMASMGVLKVGQLVEVSRKDLVASYVGQTAPMVEAAVNKAIGGVLFIDEAYTLLQNENDSFGKEAIDTLLKQMEDRRGEFICIAAGYDKEMGEFLKSNSGLISRFNETIHFDDYNGEQLYDIFQMMLKGEKMTFDATDEVWLRNYFKKMYLMRSAKFGNARDVRNVLDKAKKQQAQRIFIMQQTDLAQAAVQDTIIKKADIAGDDKEKTLDELLTELDAFVGMDSIKQQVRELAAKIQFDRMSMAAGVASAELTPVHILLTGNPGTGKTTLARKLGEVFKAIGMLPSDKVWEHDRSTLVSKYSNESAELMAKACDDAMGGILFIDEAYTLAPPSPGGGSQDKAGVEAVETLMKRMEDGRGKFVVICAGYRKQMEEFLLTNPGLSRRFTHRMHIDDYSAAQLEQIFRSLAKKKGFTIDPDADEPLTKCIALKVDAKDENFGNAGEMVKLFEQTQRRLSSRLMEKYQKTGDIKKEEYTAIHAADIPYEGPKKVSVDECLAKLDNLVGLQGVKDEVRKMANIIRLEQMRAQVNGETAKILADHYIFYGNPGTGKTTVARIMADIFVSLGLLPTNKLVEVARQDLVAPYVGQTAPKVESVVRSALGGVLFIDEAYTLNQGENDSFGHEAIDALVKLILDNKGRLVVILAGYTKDMQDFLDANVGLASRFTKKIEFEDYKPDELTKMFCMAASRDKYVLTPEAEENARLYFRQLYDSRDKTFGNARTANNVYNKVRQNMATRLVDHISDLKKEDFVTIRPEDIPYEGPKKVSVDECLAKLDNLVGLQGVKDDVRKMANIIRLEQMRAQVNGETAKILADHYIFYGNPGTGKTTVARIMADIFVSLGLLPTNKLVEVARQDLVAPYVGQTAPKVESVVRSALGGVLFIDEAYTLNQGENDSFGHEAIDALVKLILDNKGRLVVILAGYTQDMQMFLDANAGLASRFTKKINFEDYKPDELFTIFTMAVARDNYVLTPEAEEAASQHFAYLYSHRDKSFGNARTANNFYNAVRQTMANRLLESDNVTTEAMSTITAEDILGTK